MTRKTVQLIEDTKTIKLLADPLRREIIREITNHPQTQSQLARKLRLSSSSTMYHLKKLREAGLIKVGRSEIGAYGIVEKYYESTSILFIEDHKKVSPKLQKYFLHTHVERLRGMLAVLQLFAEKKGESIQITPYELQDMAQEIANLLPRIAEKYEQTQMEANREALIIKIYSEALKFLVSKNKWKDAFPDML